VPQAIDSVKGENLQNYGVKTLGEALSGIPNVTSQQEARFDSVYIRGFAATYDTFLDGIRDDAPYVRDFRAIERVDVSKGPAAVLYGRGSQGGVINRVSKKPQRDLESSVQLELGRWNAVSLYGDLSANLGETASVRLNVGQEQSDSYRHHINNQRKRQLFAPSVLWNITPQTQWMVQYEYGTFERPLEQGIPSIQGRPARFAWNVNYGDPLTDIVYDRNHSLRSHLTHQLAPDWTLRHSLGFFRFRNHMFNTYFNPADYASASDIVSRRRWGRDITTRNLFNTLELEGVVRTGGIEHRTLVGVDYTRQQNDPTSFKTDGSTIPSYPVGSPDPSIRYAGPMLVDRVQRHVVNSWGIYLQDQAKINDRWQVLLGVRQDGYSVESRTDPGGDAARREMAKRTSHDMSPRVGLIWTPTAEHSFYGSFSKTFMPVGGGVFGIPTAPSNNGNELPPEHTRQFEVGVKSDWLDERLSSTLSLFNLELYNKRYTDPDDRTKVLMHGKQRSRGVEWSLAGRMSGNWYMRGGVGFQKAEIMADGNTETGRLSDNAPRRNASLFVTWKPQQGWFAETGFTAVGARIGGRNGQVTLPGYVRWDALLGWRSAHWDWTLSVVNLSDSDYYASVAHSGETFLGERRQVMSSLQYRF